MLAGRLVRVVADPTPPLLFPALLLSWPYAAANAAAVAEFVLESAIGVVPKPRAALAAGAALAAAGDALRKAAILAAGPSFRHDLARVKRDDHILVTGGVYRFVRHPAYLGFTLWTLGLQLALANPLCALALTAACLRFFAARVRAEERLLVSFFGARYGAYRGATRTWLPGVG